jgi:hypothetical protein
MSMHKPLTRALLLILALLLVFCSLGASGGSYYDEKIADLKAQAEADHMRFIELPDTGYNADIAADILANDHKVLEETPTGSIKVTVLDADTNQPIDDAMVLLTATLSYYSTVDGVSTQTGNAFLAANLGQTGQDGTCLYGEPLFYHDDDILNDDGTPKTDSLDYLSVGIANVDIATAKIYLPPAPSGQDRYLSEETQLILAALDPKGIWPYADFVAAVAAIPGIEKADLAVDDMLDDWIAAYTDDTVVTLYNETDPRLNAFAGIGDAERRITIGDLKAYIDRNHPLLTDKIVNKYYRSIAGYTPTFQLSGSAEVQETVVYKDGTSEVQTDSARLYLDLFGGQQGGAGLAYISSGFSYRAYAYHPDYNSGITKGTSVRQYLTAADQELVILLSKDTPPISINSQRTVVYGRLLTAAGSPLAGARISSEDDSLSTQSDADGYFTLSIAEKGSYVMSVTPADTAEALSGSVTINGGKVSDTFTITVGDKPARYHVNWYEKGFNLAKVNQGAAANRWLLPVLIVLGVLLVVVVVLVLASRKKRRGRAATPVTAAGSAGPAGMVCAQTAYAPAAQPTQPSQPSAPAAAAIVCSQCGAPLTEQEQFCHQCGSRICPACHTASAPGTRFCCTCGRQLLP